MQWALVMIGVAIGFLVLIVGFNPFKGGVGGFRSHLHRSRADDNLSFR
jgi:hypothetical protein